MNNQELLAKVEQYRSNVATVDTDMRVTAADTSEFPVNREPSSPFEAIPYDKEKAREKLDNKPVRQEQLVEDKELEYQQPLLTKDDRKQMLKLSQIEKG
jgi:hypothetical protein